MQGAMQQMGRRDGGGAGDAGAAEMTNGTELSPDGATMMMTVSVKLGRMKNPVLIRTVYEKVSESTSY